MEINNMFIGEIDLIEREIINNMAEENCISNFDRYMNRSSKISSDVEKEYIVKLSHGFKKLIYL